MRAWFVAAPPGVVYLFGYSFSLRAQRWRSDPWVRLTVPGHGPSAEGSAHFVTGEELSAIAPLVVERWGMAGASTVEGLQRMVQNGTYVVVRVEGQDPGNYSLPAK